MKDIIFLILFLAMISCKSTENHFKELIRAEYSKKNVCFQADESGVVVNWGLSKFIKSEYDLDKLKSKNIKNENNINCDLVAFTGVLGDSIFVSMVYPFKKNIKQDVREYERWFYKPKIYCYHRVGKDVRLDTITIVQNPPIVNPWIIESEQEKGNVSN